MGLEARIELFSAAKEAFSSCKLSTAFLESRVPPRLVNGNFTQHSYMGANIWVRFGTCAYCVGQIVIPQDSHTPAYQLMIMRYCDQRTQTFDMKQRAMICTSDDLTRELNERMMKQGSSAYVEVLFTRRVGTALEVCGPVWNKLLCEAVIDDNAPSEKKWHTRDAIFKNCGDSGVGTPVIKCSAVTTDMFCAKPAERAFRFHNTLDYFTWIHAWMVKNNIPSESDIYLKTTLGYYLIAHCSEKTTRVQALWVEDLTRSDFIREPYTWQELYNAMYHSRGALEVVVYRDERIVARCITGDLPRPKKIDTDASVANADVNVPDANLANVSDAGAANVSDVDTDDTWNLVDEHNDDVIQNKIE